jgi:hypothetical protein
MKIVAALLLTALALAGLRGGHYQIAAPITGGVVRLGTRMGEMVLYDFESRGVRITTTEIAPDRPQEFA